MRVKRGPRQRLVSAGCFEVAGRLFDPVKQSAEFRGAAAQFVPPPVQVMEAAVGLKQGCIFPGGLLKIGDPRREVVAFGRSPFYRVELSDEAPLLAHQPCHPIRVSFERTRRL